jgi:uncharacterized membrane protein
MSEQNTNPTDQIDSWTAPGRNNVRLVYFLYLSSLVLGITALIGVVIAYLNRGEAQPWAQSHYTYQIRTFWIGLLYSVIAAILMTVLIGFLVMLAVLVWFIVRCVKGLQASSRGEPIANPKSWMV